VSIGATLDLVVTLVMGALLGMVAFLLRGRFDDQTEDLHSIRSDIVKVADKVADNTAEIARLTEAQKAVVANQSVASRAIERILEESDDLVDKTAQLDFATARLQERIATHDEYLKMMRDEAR